jgi:organic radical activating enzyme
MTEYNKNLSNYKKVIDEISPSFCSAKWTQSTIHLGLGHTHSCHHPRTHVIPIEEIKKNPSALHNTEHKKTLRKQMLEGVRPTECDYCWKVEDSGDLISDRIIKSFEPWSKPYTEKILKGGHTTNFNPTYLEISFSSVCNFKCSYCMPSVSSRWMEEIERFGAYPTSTNYNNLEWVKIQNKFPIPEKDYNPYVEAFWEWWPSLYQDLHTFRITGGEPLLTKHTFKVLEYIKNNPNKKLELAINSNFCVPDELFDRFIHQLKDINECVKSITIFTSCEAHGAQADYIRFGMDYTKWLSNCEKYLSELPTQKLVIMSTYNALSVTSYDKFLNDVLELNKKYGKPNFKEKILNKLFKKNIGMHRVELDIPYLNNPTHQTVEILTPDFIELIEKQIQFMQQNLVKNYNNSIGFYESEVHKLERLLGVFKKKILLNSQENNINRKDFAVFVDEHDKRRGTNFLETFPEMREFYDLCKSY